MIIVSLTHKPFGGMRGASILPIAKHFSQPFLVSTIKYFDTNYVTSVLMTSLYKLQKTDFAVKLSIFLIEMINN